MRDKIKMEDKIKKKWLEQRLYTRYDTDSEDGEKFFNIIIMKKEDFEKAFKW